MRDNYLNRLRRASLGDEIWRPGRPVTRRGFLAGGAIIASAGIAAACGGSSNNGNNNAASSVPTRAASASGTSAPIVGGGSAVAPGSTGNATPAAAARSATASAAVPKGGSITTAGIGTDAKSFHPYQTTDTVSSTYQGYVYGGSLVQYDPDSLALVGNAASKWTLSDDKKAITFTLKDMKWSDGQPLTTDDYLWTYQQASKPENKYPYASNFDPIDKYEAVDPKTLRVTMKDALVIGVEQSDVITPLPRHIWEKLDWNDPVKNPEIQNPTVASGWFKLKEWKKDDHATFVANDLAYDGRPNFDQLTVRIFGTQALAYQALKSGEIDFGGWDPQDYADAKKQTNFTVFDYYVARGSWNFIGYNLRRPALKDVNVRKALAYATDRKSIIDQIAYGLGRPIYSAFPASSWVYDDTVEHYDFNLDKARALFTQAGYTLNGQKKLVNKDGQQLSIKLLYNTPNKVREGIATVTQQQLQDLGIAVDIQGLEFQAYLSQIQKEPFDYDMYVLGWSSTTEPYFSYQIWAEASIPALNAGAYVNKDVEQLFKDSAREFDRDKRKAIYSKIQHMITDDEPYIFLYENQGFAGVNKRIGGVRATKRGITYNLNQWYVIK